jgi:cation:H+ antiporter
LIACGTSLPELVTSVTAAMKGNCDIAVGNIVGSNLFNIMFVVGITAVITPVVYSSAFFIDSLVAVAAVVLLLLCVFRKKMLTRKHGMIMLAGYVGYFAYLMV